MTVDPLRELAAHAGIHDEYLDHNGQRRFTTDDTRRTILAALGIDASTPAAARASLERELAAAAAELLAPVRVVRIDDPSRRSVLVRAPASNSATGRWHLELEAETGERTSSEGLWRGEASLMLTLTRTGSWFAARGTVEGRLHTALVDESIRPATYAGMPVCAPPKRHNASSDGNTRLWPRTSNTPA